jgi:peptide/nickel transport system permease protein
LLISVATGNLFALVLAIVIYKRLNQKNKEISIELLDILRRVFRSYTSCIGMLIVVFLFAISLCSNLTFDVNWAEKNNYSAMFFSPSLEYPFGTDNFGRCVFSRIVFGARISLIVGVTATMIPLIIGSILGAFAGYYTGRTDNIIMRFLDILYAVPSIMLAIAIIAAFGASVLTLILAISVYGIPMYARIVRGQVMSLSNAEYTEAARACGASDAVIIFKHILPNTYAPIIVRATMEIGTAVLSTSALSYLGIGIPSYVPEWGNILKVGSTYLEQYPYLAIFPGFAIMLLVLSFNFFGDGLRDALDPKMK